MAADKIRMMLVLTCTALREYDHDDDDRWVDDLARDTEAARKAVEEALTGAGWDGVMVDLDIEEEEPQ